MTNDEKLEDKYVEKIVSMGYTEENARDYIESQKPKSVVIDPNLGLNDTERNEVKLPEVKESVFASSSNILLPSQRNVNPYARGLAVLLLIGCVAGLLNGVDFLSPTSGLNKPHDLIYAQTINAPEDSAIFLGTVILEDGSPAQNFTINVRAERGGNHFTTTDDEGKFRMENLTPSLSLWDIAIVEDDITYGVSHRMLLNPPAGFEPYGFTQIDIVFPDKSEFGTDNGTGVFWIDYSPDEMEFPLIDPSAATIYSIFGYAFVGLALLGGILSLIALNTGNLGLVRSASGLVFFSMGHFYSACCLGLIVLLLSFVIPKNEGF
jgi:hypothetical protein|tara:strand:+ start:2313 stop:3275 length:963 start_codon:yes stop_codon:yes gene_type:complete